jgi:hypothetical protein
MNPDMVYRRYRDDAMASQLTSKRYGIFVAMPFGDRFGYRSRVILKDVIQAAAARANKCVRDGTDIPCLRFEKPYRADNAPQVARVITDDIVRSILSEHFFIADLTDANEGVLVEVGVALALKPTSRLILITQSSVSDLHFDIRDNNVIQYGPDGSLEKITTALVFAARAFELERREYMTSLRHELSADAVLLMNWIGACRSGFYGRVQAVHEDNPPLHLQRLVTDGQHDQAAVRFQLAVRELLVRRLIWNFYSPQSPQPGQETWSYRATRLGWMFIEQTWNGLRRPPKEELEPPRGLEVPATKAKDRRAARRESSRF